MRIHVYLLAYNEKKLLPLTINHYKTFADHIYVLDNESDDGSEELAEDMVTFLPYITNGLIDDLTRVEKRVRAVEENEKTIETRADWVINCDVDEIIFAPNLRNLLEQYLSDGVTVPKVLGTEMVSYDEPVPWVSLIDQYRLGYPIKHFNKRVIYRSAFPMAYPPGGHPTESHPNWKRMISTPGFKENPVGGILLLHFKWIGNRAIERAKVSAPRRSQRDKEHGLASHYDWPEERYEKRMKEISQWRRLILKQNDTIEINWKPFDR
jgi:glycosyltransferase involved in cell wall biosynthesis